MTEQPENQLPPAPRSAAPQMPAPGQDPSAFPGQQPGPPQGPPQPPYGAPPGAPYPYPPYPYPPYAAPFNVYAILSLALGLLVFPPLGIYFGYKSRQQIERTGERGIELATAGIIVGWIFTGFLVLWCLFAATVMAGPLLAATWS